MTEELTTITFVGSTENTFYVHVPTRTLTVTFDPRVQEAYIFNLKSAAEFTKEMIGQRAARPFIEFTRDLALDNTLWSSNGKWLGESWTRTWVA